jgi:hypothetical protein
MPEPIVPKSQRRWLRFRSRTILIVVAFAGLAFGAVSYVTRLDSLERIGLLFVFLGVAFLLGCFLFPVLVIGITSLVVDRLPDSRTNGQDRQQRPGEH